MTGTMSTRDLRLNLQMPGGGLRITTVDMHTGGEPLRVITGGLPEIAGRTVLEKRRYLVPGPEVSFNVPAGRVQARAKIEAGRIVSTTFRNVPSFVYRRDQLRRGFILR